MSESEHHSETREQVGDGSFDSLTVVKTTKFAHMGYRCAYTFIAWLVLAKGIVLGPGFFTSLILFLIPLLFDYLRLAPYSKWRIRIKGLEIGFTFILILIGTIGLCGDIVVTQQKETLMLMISNDYLILKGVILFPLYILWGSLSISVFLTVVDYFLYKEPFDDEYLTYHLSKKEKQRGVTS